jgi:O-antigen ligase
MIKENQKYLNAIQILLDLIIVLASFSLAYYFRFYILKDGVISLSYAQSILPVTYILPIYLVVYSTLGLYDSRRIRPLFKEASILITGNAISLLFLILILFLFKIMDFSRYTFRNTKDYKYIIASLLVVIVVNTVLGVSQYFGNDLYNTAFVKNIIMPKELAKNAAVELAYEEGKIYGTMFHYNYMGSFGAMMVPLFAVLTMLIKNVKAKLASSIATLASLFLLLGSTSRAGLIGLSLAFIIAIILFGKFILKRWKLVIPIVAGFVIILASLNIVTKGTIFSRIPTLINDAFGIFMPSEEGFDYKDHIPVRDIITKEGKVYITLQSKEEIVVEYTKEEPGFYDAQGNEIDYTLNGNTYDSADSRFSHVSFQLIGADDDQEVKDAMIIYVNNIPAFMLRMDQKVGVYLADSFTGEKIDIDYPETLGFKKKERLGSARGYIWSRSLPMLKETFLVGYGPDVFIMKFPQRDYLGKYYAYDTPNMTVDKPHNLYLQIAINQGIIALLAFLALTCGYIAESIKIYALKDHYDSKEAIGMATMLAIVGYMGAGFFNDSIVSVAPIFWILLGVGVSINYLVKKERRRVEKKLKHATIDMKTRKHVKRQAK